MNRARAPSPKKPHLRWRYQEFSSHSSFSNVVFLATEPGAIIMIRAVAVYSVSLSSWFGQPPCEPFSTQVAARSPLRVACLALRVRHERSRRRLSETPVQTRKAPPNVDSPATVLAGHAPDFSGVAVANEILRGHTFTAGSDES